MGAFLVGHESLVRLGGFLGVLIATAIWESAAPRRRRVLPRASHALHNLALVAVDALALRLVFSAAAVGAASWAEGRGLGLLRVAGAPPAAAWAASLALLDLAVWAQHVASHRVPLLWRLHRVHHADVDLDVTSGVRFHPLEVLLSMAWKIAVVVALGAPPGAVVLFEVLLNATALWNHGNLRVPPHLERALRLVLVTPDVHRVHHSIHRDETDSNYGFQLTLWDRLFHTWRPAPRDGHEAMRLGLEDCRDERDAARLLGMLALPFRRGGSSGVE